MNHPHLLLLHGALGSSAQFAAWLPQLEERYTVSCLDFEGHGKAARPERPFRLEHFVENVFAFLDTHDIAQTRVFGHSMGGFVACLAALEQPQRFLHISTLGTKFRWDTSTAAREVPKLDPDTIARKVPQLAAALAQRHGDDWQTVVRRSAELLQHLGEVGEFRDAALARIRTPMRILVGERDNMVSVAETRAAAICLPQAECRVLPDTPHPIEQVALASLAI
ncbi:3-oxoadipate enol-lactonase 2 [Burkholderiales bacterium]|nr:MAG: alpha/beta hydrolase [Burkholderiales bacterium]CAG0999759.1 3-oxoadipate enol-lactonase 2 [Burkholderiales bacterium]